MSTSTNQVDPLDGARAETLLNQVVLSRAAHLARAGNYAAAEDLLAGLLSGDQADASVFDLLARVRAQKGALREAEALWQQVLRLDPKHAGAQAALVRLRRQQRQPAWLAPVGALAAVFCVVSLGAGVLWLAHSGKETEVVAFQRLRSDLNNSQTAQFERASAQMDLFRQSLVASQQTTSNALARNLEEMQKTVATLAEQQKDFQHQCQQVLEEARALATNRPVELHPAGSTAQPAVALAPASPTANPPGMTTQIVAAPVMALDFHVPGVGATPQSDGYLIRFDEGLFDRDGHFKMDSRALLESVAKALVKSQERWSVEIIGIADEEPPTWPWSKPKGDAALGLERAEKARQCLGRLEIFPASALRTAAGRAQDRPYPGDTAANRLRNRTVLLRISRVEQAQ